MSDPETVRWLIGGACALAMLMLGGMATIIKTMVVARFKSLDATVHAHFLEASAQQQLIESKLDEIRHELTSKIDGVREEFHDLELRFTALEKEHELLTQKGNNHVCLSEVINGS